MVSSLGRVNQVNSPEKYFLCAWVLGLVLTSYKASTETCMQGVEMVLVIGSNPAGSCVIKCVSLEKLTQVLLASASPGMDVMKWSSSGARCHHDSAAY